MPVMQTLNEQRVPVKIWTNDIDDKAKIQLSNVASLPFIHHHVAAMPDVHSGGGGRGYWLRHVGLPALADRQRHRREIVAKSVPPDQPRYSCRAQSA